MNRGLIGCRFAPIIKNNDVLSVIGSIFWGYAEGDRFGLLNKKSPYNFTVESGKELPKGIDNDYSMQGLCVDKASEIIKSTNEEIVVMWSGGIDSTAVICSFILANVSKKQLVICYTNESIEENKNFYEWLIKNGYRMIKYSWSSFDKLLLKFRNAKFVIGWCADQLFGSVVNQRYPKLFHTEYKDGLRIMLADKYPSNVIDNCIEEYSGYADTLKIQLKYTCDALWLFNFAVKWSHVSRDFKLLIKDNKQRNNVINFFEDIRFQEWSLAHYPKFHLYEQYEPSKFKLPLKNLIYKVNGDEDYLKNKGKKGSWRFVIRPLNSTCFSLLDTEGYKFYSINDNMSAKEGSIHPHEIFINNVFDILKVYLKDTSYEEELYYNIREIYSPYLRIFTKGI